MASRVVSTSRIRAVPIMCPSPCLHRHLSAFMASLALGYFTVQEDAQGHFMQLVQGTLPPDLQGTLLRYACCKGPGAACRGWCIVYHAYIHLSSVHVCVAISIWPCVCTQMISCVVQLYCTKPSPHHPLKHAHTHVHTHAHTYYYPHPPPTLLIAMARVDLRQQQMHHMGIPMMGMAL